MNTEPEVHLGKIINLNNGMVGFKIGFKDKTMANKWKHSIEQYFLLKGINVDRDDNGYYDDKFRFK